LLYTFENCSLDVDRRELRRDDCLVALEPQVFDLLLFLIRNRERVVSKDDLVAHVWNSRAVSDSTLTSRIAIARQAIGDSGGEQRLIRTFSRKGVRFVGHVSEGVSEKGAWASLPPAHESPRASMKILLVDDHVLIREALRGVLKGLRNGATILEAADARGALQAIDQDPEIELIVLDLTLPDRDGFDLLAELRKRHPTVSVVVLSASQQADQVARALDLGALGFIPKTASREVMLSAFNLIFAGGIYVPPEILSPRTGKPRG
jgi:DNA-binding response OmpR family regulator